MARNRTLLAAAVTITILIPSGRLLRADDGKPGEAKQAAAPQKPAASADAKPGAAPSPEQAKTVLRKALKLIQAMAAEATRKEREFNMQSPADFAMRLTKDQHADALRAIGRAQARLGDLPAARATWQSALDVAAAVAFLNSSLSPTSYRPTLLIGIAEAQIESGERDEARFTLRQALQAARAATAELPFPMPMPPGMGNDRDESVKKVEALRRIAQLQDKAGETANAAETLRLALETADAIKAPLTKVRELVEIAGSAPPETAAATWARAARLRDGAGRIPALAGRQLHPPRPGPGRQDRPVPGDGHRASQGRSLYLCAVGARRRRGFQRRRDPR